MASISLPNQESQELIRLFIRKKNTLPLPNYSVIAYVSFKLVLNIFVGYEPNHKTSPKSLYNEQGITVENRAVASFFSAVIIIYARVYG